MTKKVAFTTVALAAGIAVIAYAQDPRFDSESIAPYLEDSAKPEIMTVGQPITPATASSPAEDEISVTVTGDAEAGDDPISVTLTNAKTDDIVKWLGKNGFNVVVPNSEIDSKRRISLSLKNVAREEVLDVIASALGGRWETKGSTKIFKKGSFGLYAPVSASIAGVPLTVRDGIALTPGTAVLDTIPRIAEALPALPVQGFAIASDGKQHEKFAKDMSDWAVKFASEFGAKFGPEFADKWSQFGEKFGKEFGEKFSKEFQSRDWKKFGETMERTFASPNGKEWKVFGDQFEGRFDSAEMQKHFKEMEKHFNSAEMQKHFNSEEMQKHLKDMEKHLNSADMQKHFQEMEKKMNSPEMQKHFKEMEKKFNSPEAHAKWKAFGEKMEKEFNSPESKAKWEKLAKDMEGKAKLAEKDALVFELRAKELEGKAKTLAINGADMDLRSLAKSLTTEQRAKHKKDGFLRIGDLTPAQRKFLGKLSADGNWTVQYSVEDERLTIKSDRD